MYESNLIFRENGLPLNLEKTFARGGEGTLWHVHGQKDVIAKIYHKPQNSIGEKLQHMIDNPPHDPFSKQNSVSFAWPTARLFNKKGTCCGFLMPYISSTLTLSQVYHPKLRSKYASSFNWYYLHTVARNAAQLLDALHSQNYIIGDIKTDNLLIHSNALVSWVDMDSLQITTKEQIFPCLVRSDDFASPESTNRSSNLTKQHDCFALAVLIHLTLLGYHPFANAPAHNRIEYVKKGQWIATARSAPAFALPYTILTPEIVESFHKVFSHPSSPHQRPKASWWAEACSYALQQMEPCPQNIHHFYLPHNEICTWCSYKKVTSVDPFASPSTTNHLRDLLEELKNMNWRKTTALIHDHPYLSSLPLDKERKKALQTCLMLSRAHAHFSRLAPQEHSHEKIISLWKDYARKEGIPSLRTLPFPFPELISTTAKHEDELNTLRTLCARLENAGSIDPYVAENITEITEALTMKGVMIEHIHDLAEKCKRAATVSTIWRKLLEALHNQNSETLAAMNTQYHSMLRSINMPASYRQNIDQAVHDSLLINKINTILASHPNERDNILSLLEQNKSILHSSFCHTILNNSQTVQEIYTTLKRKRDLKPTLENALKKRDFIAIAHLWDSQFSEPSGLWKELTLAAQKGSNLTKKWIPVKRAILEGEQQYLRTQWSEKDFGTIAKHEGLAQQTQDAVKAMFKGVSFPTNPKWPFSYISHQLLRVIFPWPICTPPIPFCLITWRSDRHPRSILDMEKTHIAHCTAYSHRALHEVIIPYSGKKAFVSVWPAATIACSTIPVHAPLHIQSAPNIHIAYRKRIRLKRKINHLCLEVHANQTLSNIKLAITEAPPINPLAIKVIQEFSIISLVAGKTIKLHTQITNPHHQFSLVGYYDYGEHIPTYCESL
ncbi:MAG: hypothetical protein OXC30_02515 [Alphaproteobacteria bacterium]|nr:hypothetical protein [Alphaproteobacteria bacterium]